MISGLGGLPSPFESPALGRRAHARTPDEDLFLGRLRTRRSSPPRAGWSETVERVARASGPRDLKLARAGVEPWKGVRNAVGSA